jgi:signal transduction histidine kinase
MSLLGNAIYAVVKKSKRQQAQETPEIDITMTQKEDKVQILIRDNGTGIEDKIIHKIFDPFFTTKTTGEASGVGLYLSREIIQNYGGDITVISEKNEYTEFSIILPILK